MCYFGLFDSLFVYLCCRFYLLFFKWFAELFVIYIWGNVSRQIGFHIPQRKYLRYTPACYRFSPPSIQYKALHMPALVTSVSTIINHFKCRTQQALTQITLQLQCWKVYLMKCKLIYHFKTGRFETAERVLVNIISYKATHGRQYPQFSGFVEI